MALLATKNGDRKQVPLSSQTRELFELMNPKSHGNIFNITSDTGVPPLGNFLKKAILIV